MAMDFLRLFRLEKTRIAIGRNDTSEMVLVEKVEKVVGFIWAAEVRF